MKTRLKIECIAQYTWMLAPKHTRFRVWICANHPDTLGDTCNGLPEKKADRLMYREE